MKVTSGMIERLINESNDVLKGTGLRLKKAHEGLEKCNIHMIYGNRGFVILIDKVHGHFVIEEVTDGRIQVLVEIIPKAISEVKALITVILSRYIMNGGKFKVKLVQSISERSNLKLLMTEDIYFCTIYTEAIKAAMKYSLILVINANLDKNNRLVVDRGTCPNISTVLNVGYTWEKMDWIVESMIMSGKQIF